MSEHRIGRGNSALRTAEQLQMDAGRIQFIVLF